MNQDFQDLLHELSAANARFLVVGAYAMAVHGVPRATGDIDVWVEPTAENAAKVWEALKQFGAPLQHITIRDLSQPDVVFQMGPPPRRIDILTQISGVEFEVAWQNRISGMFGEVEAFVIGTDELLQNKRATGRPRDLIDVDMLEEFFSQHI